MLVAKLIAHNTSAVARTQQTQNFTRHLIMRVYLLLDLVGDWYIPPEPEYSFWKSPCSKWTFSYWYLIWSASGYLYCDAPPDLALSTFTTMPQFFDMSNVSFSLFTGDIVSHDDDDQVRKLSSYLSEI